MDPVCERCQHCPAVLWRERPRGGLDVNDLHGWLRARLVPCGSLPFDRLIVSALALFDRVSMRQCPHGELGAGVNSVVVVVVVVVHVEVLGTAVAGWKWSSSCRGRACGSGGACGCRVVVDVVVVGV